MLIGAAHSVFDSQYALDIVSCLDLFWIFGIMAQALVRFVYEHLQNFKYGAMVL